MVTKSKRMAEKGMIRKAGAFILAALMAVLIPLNGFCAEGMAEYQVAETKIEVSLPQNFLYSDRGITDDDLFCIRTGRSAESFKEAFLCGNYYMSVFVNVWFIP